MIRHDVFLRVVRAARPIAAEARPGRQQDGRAEFCAGAELQRLDFGLRVQQVREDADGQVRACGVAAYDDVFGAVAQGGEDVAEERDGLLELVRVGGVRGEGVGEHEGGDGGGDQGGDEGDVAGVYGEVVAAALGRGACALAGVLGKGLGLGRSVPWNQSITFSADGLPNQYALVPSGRVSSLGVKPCFLANSGYASSRSAPMYLHQGFQSIVYLGYMERYGGALTVDVEPSCFP